MGFETDHDFTWVQEAFRARGIAFDGESRTLPHFISDRVAGVFDANGYKRFENGPFAAGNHSALNTTSVNGAITPANVLRYCFSIAVDHDDTATAQTCWVEYSDAGIAGSASTGIMPAVLNLPALVGNARTRPFLLRPGSRLIARCSPGTGVGFVIRLRFLAIDLPIGESIPGL